MEPAHVRNRRPHPPRAAAVGAAGRRRREPLLPAARRLPLRGVTATADGRLDVDGHVVGPGGLYAPGPAARLPRPRRPRRRGRLRPAAVLPPAAAAAEAAAWARAVNDGLLAAVADRERLLPLAYLPLEHPEIALAEYERVRDDDRWSGLCASAGGRSTSLADDALAPCGGRSTPTRACCCCTRAAHPTSGSSEFYLANLLGNPVETAVAAAQLVFGDVLPAHPRMRVLLVHCGGCLPGVVGRWERGVATARPGLKPLSEAPREAVRRLHVDCLAHDPAVVSHAVELFGPDKLLLGSDWPFPMGIDDPRELIAHLPAELRRRVAVDNAQSALHTFLN